MSASAPANPIGYRPDIDGLRAIAIVLVVAVIWVFLRNWPATIIPGITVPLSLLGTVAIIYGLGFSLNNLTLMALTVATGFLVDDARDGSRDAIMATWPASPTLLSTTCPRAPTSSS